MQNQSTVAQRSHRLCHADAFFSSSSFVSFSFFRFSFFLFLFLLLFISTRAHFSHSIFSSPSAAPAGPAHPARKCILTGSRFSFAVSLVPSSLFLFFFLSFFPFHSGNNRHAVAYLRRHASLSHTQSLSLPLSLSHLSQSLMRFCQRKFIESLQQSQNLNISKSEFEFDRE